MRRGLDGSRLRDLGPRHASPAHGVGRSPCGRTRPATGTDAPDSARADVIVGASRRVHDRSGWTHGSTVKASGPACRRGPGGGVTSWCRSSHVAPLGLRTARWGTSRGDCRWRSPRPRSRLSGRPMSLQTSMKSPSRPSGHATGGRVACQGPRRRTVGGLVPIRGRLGSAIDARPACRRPAVDAATRPAAESVSISQSPRQGPRMYSILNGPGYVERQSPRTHELGCATSAQLGRRFDGGRMHGLVHTWESSDFSLARSETGDFFAISTSLTPRIKQVRPNVANECGARREPFGGVIDTLPAGRPRSSSAGRPDHGKRALRMTPPLVLRPGHKPGG